MRKVEKIDGRVKIKTAFISVFDKTNLNILVEGLIEIIPDIKIFTTGGTYRAIKKMLSQEDFVAHIQEVSEYTGQSETEGGLVKSLHHKLFLGYLTETYCPAHQNDLDRENAVPVDLVVVNFYPFNEVINQQEVDFESARMNIDIGGPAGLRAPAKNFHRVMTLTSPEKYSSFLRELYINNGQTTLRDRFLAAREVFELTAQYDQDIFNYFASIGEMEQIENCYEVLNS